jgi:hypothetical protein
VREGGGGEESEGEEGDYPTSILTVTFCYPLFYCIFSTKFVRMVCFAGEWDKAYKLASQYLGSSEVSAMYISHAKSLEEQGKLREAEKLYLFVSEPDMAISMYKKHHQYDQVRWIEVTILPPLGSGKLSVQDVMVISP